MNVRIGKFKYISTLVHWWNWFWQFETRHDKKRKLALHDHILVPNQQWFNYIKNFLYWILGLPSQFFLSWQCHNPEKESPETLMKRLYHVGTYMRVHTHTCTFPHQRINGKISIFISTKMVQKLFIIFPTEVAYRKKTYLQVLNILLSSARPSFWADSASNSAQLPFIAS